MAGEVAGAAGTGVDGNAAGSAVAGTEAYYEEKVRLLEGVKKQISQDTDELRKRLSNAKQITTRLRKERTYLLDRLISHELSRRPRLPAGAGVLGRGGAAIAAGAGMDGNGDGADDGGANRSNAPSQASNLMAPPSMPSGAGARLEPQNSSPGAKSAKRKRDPNQPKKPKNAFFLFCADERPKVAATVQGVPPSEITKRLGMRWKELSAEERQVYSDKAKENMEEFEKLYPKQPPKRTAKQSAAAGDTKSVGSPAPSASARSDRMASPSPSLQPRAGESPAPSDFSTGTPMDTGSPE